MPLPALKNWQDTAPALHQALLLIGPIHNALFPTEPNYLNLPMHPQPFGLTSYRFQGGNQIHVDFKQATVFYRRKTGNDAVLPITEHTQASLFEALLGELKADVLSDFFADVEAESLAAGLMTKIEGDPDKTVFLKLDDVTKTEPLTLDTTVASEYANALYATFTGIARFRSRLNGHMTPIVVWSEHFDLSTLWFKDPEMDDSKAHLNFGFAPFGGGFERPYLYAYAYPYPDGMAFPQLPAPARWHTDGWTGVVVDYDDLASAENAEKFIEDLCLKISDVLTPMLY